MEAPTDLRTALQQTTAALAERSDLKERAQRDAQQLVEIATGLARVQQLASPGRTLSAIEQQTLRSLLQRRLQAEPIQYLRGSQQFYGRDFLVTPDTLIPRPETEGVVTAVLEATPDRNRPLRIADVGTGSGILAVTLALELPQSTVMALDLSPAALAIARRNAQRLGAAERVQFLESDLLNAVTAGDLFDVIVSNPPYIPTADAPTLHAEVLEYEPHLALFAGHDGHDVYQRLIPEAHGRLRPGGLLVLETGGRVDLILSWLQDWHPVQVRDDLQSIPRVITARRA